VTDDFSLCFQFSLKKNAKFYVLGFILYPKNKRKQISRLSRGIAGVAVQALHKKLKMAQILIKMLFGWLYLF
jgi:hypothetical protein